MRFDYTCTDCGKVVNNDDMDSFLCECGGTFRLGSRIDISRTFHPEWDEVTRTYVSSYRQQERLAKKEGCVVTPSDMTKRLKHIRKNKEDFNRGELAKRGIRVKHGEAWSDEKCDVVRVAGRRRSYFYG